MIYISEAGLIAIQVAVIAAVVIFFGVLIGVYVYKKIHHIPTGGCAECRKSSKKLLKEYQKKYGVNKMKEIVLKIDGMKCGMCESHVNDKVRRLKGVKKVNSNHSTGKVSIVTDYPNLELIKKTIEEEGYKVLSEETYEVKKTLFGYKKI